MLVLALAVARRPLSLGRNCWWRMQLADGRGGVGADAGRHARPSQVMRRTQTIHNGTSRRR
jgi:hypothetical protein